MAFEDLGIPSIFDPPDTSITNTVQTYIAENAGWAESVYSEASGLLAGLTGMTFNVTYAPPAFNSIDIPAVNPTPPGSRPGGDVSYKQPDFKGTSPTIPEDLNLVTYPVPEYAEKDYGIDIPESPNVLWPTFTKEAPGMPDRVIPTIPAEDIPPIPRITDVTIPSPPNFDDPQFTAQPPVEDLTVPPVNFTWGESVYQSALKTKLGDVLFQNLVSGGSGLDEVTEQAIYDRALSRQEEAEQVMVDELSDDVAQRGFDIPPGALLTLSSEAENKILRSRADLNKDILVQQSNLAQTNTHFIITQVAGLETVLINYHSETQTRALDAAKFTVTVAMQAYSLKLEAYKTKLTAYQILAQVYETQIRAQIAKAEFYKAQIEGAKLSVEIQELYIRAYLGQLEGIKATLAVYKLQMEGAQLAASIDKLKLDGYMSEVQAYGIKVNAVTQRFEGYKAQLSGEAIKGQLKQTDVNIYAARSSAYNINNQAEIAKAETALKLIQMNAAVYEQAINKYRADVAGASASVDAQAKVVSADATAYAAEANAYATELRASMSMYEALIAQAKAEGDLAVKNAENMMKAALGNYELVLEAARGTAQIAGQLAAAAAGSINASLHASSSESDSTSTNKSVSSNYDMTKTITSKSFIEEHIYSYSN